MKNILSNKVSGGDIPIQIFKQSGFIFQILRDYINVAVNNNVFPENLKIANYFLLLYIYLPLTKTVLHSFRQS